MNEEPQEQLKEQPIQRFDADSLGVLTTPLSLRGFPPWLIYFAALLGFIYILNPGAGVIEFIPDNIPLIGNLDEGAAFMLLWYGLVEYFEGRKIRRNYRLHNLAAKQEDDLANDPHIIDV